MARSYTEKTLKKLFTLSGNQCAMPDCTVELIQGDVIVGRICHIKGHSPLGPRYDAEMSATSNNDYENLILLCSNDHAIIDDKSRQDEFTVQVLKDMKSKHEKNVEAFDISTPLATKIHQYFSSSEVSIDGNNNIGVALSVSGQGSNEVTIGLSPAEVKEQFILLFPTMMPAFLGEVEQLMNNRMRDLNDEFKKAHADKVSYEDLRTALKDPDFLYFMQEVRKTVVSSDSEEIRKALARLVALRVSGDSAFSRQAVAMSQVPNVINNSTKSQLKLLAARFLAHSVTLRITSSREIMDNFYKSLISPMGVISYHSTDIEHLASLGALHISISSTSAYNTLVDAYRRAFLKPLSIEAADEIGLTEKQKGRLLVKQNGGYFFLPPFKDWDELFKVLQKEITSQEKIDALYNLIKASEMSDVEKRDIIAQDMPYVDKLIKLDEATKLGNTFLNTSGKLAAIVYIEAATGLKLDFNIWVPNETSDSFDLT